MKFQPEDEWVSERTLPCEVALIKVAEQYNLKADVVSHPDCGAHGCILILSSCYM